MHPYVMVVADAKDMLLMLKRTLESGEEQQRMVTAPYKASPVTSGEAATAVTEPTAREKEILKLIAEGHPNKQIGCVLGISEQTVKNHISAVMRKLNANDRTHAVVLALYNGWLNIEEVSEMAVKEEPASTPAHR